MGEIHLIERGERPPLGSLQRANCGHSFFIFSEPITARWNDGRVCQKCLKIHNEFGKFNTGWGTFAFFFP